MKVNFQIQLSYFCSTPEFFLLCFSAFLTCPVNGGLCLALWGGNLTKTHWKINHYNGKLRNAAMYLDTRRIQAKVC